MNYIIIIGAFQSLVALTLYAAHRRKRPAEAILNLLLVCICIHLCIKFIIYAVSETDGIKVAFNSFTDVAYGPLLWIYTNKVANRRYNPLKHWYLLLPAFLASVVFFAIVLHIVTGSHQYDQLLYMYNQSTQYVIMVTMIVFPLMALHKGKQLPPFWQAEAVLIKRISLLYLFMGLLTFTLVCIINPLHLIKNYHTFNIAIRILAYSITTVITLAVIRYRLSAVAEETAHTGELYGITPPSDIYADTDTLHSLVTDAGTETTGTLIAVAGTKNTTFPVNAISGESADSPATKTTTTGLHATTALEAAASQLVITTGAATIAPGVTGMASAATAAVNTTTLAATTTEASLSAAAKPAAATPAKRFTLTLHQQQTIIARLTEVMEKQKAYADSDLTLEKLSALSKLPRHHISEALNQHLGKTFYQFLNDYRINAVLALLDKCRQKHVQPAILSLAFEAGFNSKSTFNQYFKKTTGFTPSEYMKKDRPGMEANTRPRIGNVFVTQPTH